MSESTGSLEIDAFFSGRKRAAAALKHAVLRRYLTVFIARTGSTALNNQVVVVDGYAGVGRYRTGEPGSPALIAGASRNRSASNRRLLALLVEENKAHFDRLNEVMSQEPAAATFTYQTYQGSVRDHLDALLVRAQSQPLLMFLDPYGLGPTLDELAAIFASRAKSVPNAYRSPATEVLLRFDARFIRLIQGHLRGYLNGEMPSGRAGLILRMDNIAGGTWWHDGAELPNAEFRDWFIENYLREIGNSIGANALQIPVMETVAGDVKYYLVFLTLRREGFFSFLDTTSGAFQEWRNLLRDHPEDVFDEDDIRQWGITDQDMVEDFEEDEQRLELKWISTIETNLTTVLARRPRFPIYEEYQSVLGEVIGFARAKHVRAALRTLLRRGEIINVTTGDPWFIEVVKAPAQAQPQLDF